MIRVTVEITHPSGRAEPTDIITITNAGPVAPDELWDSGGERWYEVTDAQPRHGPFGERRVVRVRHFRRDGRRRLIVKAIEALPDG